MEGPIGPSDELALLRARDGATWEGLYRRMFPAMLAFADRRLGSREDARDAVAEAMTRAVASIERFSDRGAGPDGWIFGILRHVVLDASRRVYRRRGRSVITEVPPCADLSEDLVVADEHAAVRRAFACLTDRERDVIELKVVVGLSSAEIAEALGMQPGAVRMAQTRALARLRRMLQHREGVDAPA